MSLPRKALDSLPATAKCPARAWTAVHEGTHRRRALREQQLLQRQAHKLAAHQEVKRLGRVCRTATSTEQCTQMLAAGQYLQVPLEFRGKALSVR